MSKKPRDVSHQQLVNAYDEYLRGHKDREHEYRCFNVDGQPASWKRLFSRFGNYLLQVLLVVLSFCGAILLLSVVAAFFQGLDTGKIPAWVGWTAFFGVICAVGLIFAIKDEFFS